MTPPSTRLIDAALSLRGKRVVLAGLGLFGGGVAAARYLAEKGAEVLVTDLKTEADLAGSMRALEGVAVEYKLGWHDHEDFEQADLVVANPAIPIQSPHLQSALSADVAVTTEIGLFAAAYRGKTIAVTGTSGKTTTTTLLGQIVSNAVPDTLVGGNMGVSLLDRLEETTEKTTAVLELSSFQLRYLGWMGWRPDVAVVTNFAPNHLDIHDGLEDYRICKQQILAGQAEGDRAILNAEDEEMSGWTAGGAERRWFGEIQPATNGVFLDGGEIASLEDGRRSALCPVSELRIPGRHNQINACAAACAALSVGVSADLVSEGMVSFGGVEHRLEHCGTIDNVDFYNDSIATSPERTCVALDALDAPIVLILGGSDKGLEYGEMGRRVSERAKGVILMGETRNAIAASILDVSMDFAESLEQALEIARQRAKAGDAVLLSPASASFDMFANFEDRGRQFKRLVQSMMA